MSGYNRKWEGKGLRKTLFMETTKISVSQTVGEIQRILGEYGASSILIDYENGEPIAIMFEIKLHGKTPSFELPCRWQPIKDHLDEKYPPQEYTYSGQLKQRNNIEQSKRVAWRQILRWVEAQLALVETKMVKIQEIFLPYLITNNGTLYNLIEKKGFMIEYKKEGENVNV